MPAPSLPAATTQPEITPGFRVPEIEQIQARLQEKMDLILTAITPEKLAAASLSQLTSALKAMTNRAQTLQDATARARAQYIEDTDAYRQQLANVLKRHIPDQKTLMAIGTEMDAYAGHVTPEPDSPTENSETSEISPVPQVPNANPHPSQGTGTPLPRAQRGSYAASRLGEAGIREAGDGGEVEEALSRLHPPRLFGYHENDMTTASSTGTPDPKTITETEPPLVLLEMPLAVVPAGVIFDCDGTLADTMPLHYRAWRETLDGLGATLPVFPEEQFYSWGGVTAREILQRLNVIHHLDLDPAAVAHAKEMDYRRLIPTVQPIEIVVAEARRLHGKCPLAVASGGMRALVEETLNTLGIRDLFETVVGSEDVTHGKPAPDVFLEAARRIGIPPTECIVFEDAPAGLEAARRAGMRAVDITRFIQPGNPG